MREVEEIINKLKNKIYVSLEISYIRSGENFLLNLRLYYEDTKNSGKDLKKDFSSMDELSNFLKEYLEQLNQPLFIN